MNLKSNMSESLSNVPKLIETDLIDVNLYVPDGSALDDLWRDCNSPFYKHDALVLQARSPLDHLLAHLAFRDAHKCLNSISPLAQAQETHFVSLRTRGLDTCAEQDSLALEIRRKGGYLSSRAIRPCLRLVNG